MNSSDKKPYIFISYAHADSARVLPAIASLQKSGVSLWYDNGIAAGSEWPEFIAEKVVGCVSFVLFISNAYLDSQNCKRELNFAISRKKNILSIFLEEVELSPGMEMQLGSYQAIYKKRFTSDAAFCSSLAAESFFDNCRIDAGEHADTSEAKQTADVGDTGSALSQSTAKKKRFSVSDSAFNKKADTSGSAPKQKSKTMAGILALLLSALGINYFYLGTPLYGILSVVLCWTYVPTVINVILGVRYLTMKNEVFQRKVAQKAHPWQYFKK